MENKLHELRESNINLSLSYGGRRGFVHYLIFNEALTDGASLKIRRWAKSKKKNYASEFIPSSEPYRVGLMPNLLSPPVIVTDNAPYLSKQGKYKLQSQNCLGGRRKNPAVPTGRRSTTTRSGATVSQQLAGKRKANELACSSESMEPANRRPAPGAGSAPLLANSSVTGEQAAVGSRQPGPSG